MPADPILIVANLGVVDYPAALALQEALVAARIQDRVGDTLLLLAHPHVYTLGRGADASYIIDPPANVPIHRISRGGQVTYHGPGQLIGYPIVKLEDAERDVLRYLRKLEQVVIDALGAAGIVAGRREGLTGVWIDGEKIASIGVGIRRWTTAHGFAVNVATDLRYFERIVPCGIAGCRMTSLAALGRADVAVAEFADRVMRSFISVFGYESAVSISPNRLWSMLDAGADALATRTES